jgi:hypothetical protein
MLRHSIGSVGDELMDGYEATKEGAAPVGTAAAGVEVVAAEIQGIAVAALTAVGNLQLKLPMKLQIVRWTKLLLR